MGQAIIVQQTGIQNWGSRDDVREIGNRLAKMSLPGGKRLSEPEIFALAQASIAHGLDPFNGEIWIIPNTGLMIGIKGLRKCARAQVKGNFWTEFRVIESAPEREQIGIPDGALAYECRLFDTETINAYTTSVKQFSDTKMPWELIIEIVGKRPYTSGYGYYKRGESTKMTPVQCAMKRAEADALKRRFDVPFGMNVDDTADIAPMTAPQWESIDAVDTIIRADPQETLTQGKAALGRDDGDLTAAVVDTRTGNTIGESTPDGARIYDDAKFDIPHFEPLDLPPTAQVETQVTKPTNGKPKIASIKFNAQTVDEWKQAAMTFIVANPNWAMKNGLPDMGHIQASAGRAGYAYVDGDNRDEVFAMIEHAHRAAESMKSAA